MVRIMEIFVIANAACGIAAFLIARGLISRAKRKAHDILDYEEAQVQRREISEYGDSSTSHQARPQDP